MNNDLKITFPDISWKKIVNLVGRLFVNNFLFIIVCLFGLYLCCWKKVFYSNMYRNCARCIAKEDKRGTEI